MPKWGWASLCVLLLLLFGFLGSGLSFWASHATMRWNECLFGQAQCSEPAATWVLSAIALASLWAASLTIYFTRQAYDIAQQTYRIEIQPRLGQSPCNKHGLDNHTPDREVFIFPPVDSTHGVPAPQAKEGGVGQPYGFREKARSANFAIYHSAFNNLGRYALASVDVDLAFEATSGVRASPIGVRIGNVLTDREIHVIVYVARDFESQSVSWSNPRQKPAGSGTIAFFPEKVYELAGFQKHDAQLSLPDI